MGLEEEMISFSMAAWIPKIIFLIIVIVTIVLFVNFYAKINIDSYRAESELFTYQLLYSPDGLSYYDSVAGKINPGVIDLSKFENKTMDILNIASSQQDMITGAATQPVSVEEQFPVLEVLQKTIDYGAEKHLGAQILIKYIDGTVMKKVYYNPRVYQRIQERGIGGIGGIDVVEKELYVLAKDKNIIIPAFFNITIVVERSR